MKKIIIKKPRDNKRYIVKWYCTNCNAKWIQEAGIFDNVCPCCGEWTSTYQGLISYKIDGWYAKHLMKKFGEN